MSYAENTGHARCPDSRLEPCSSKNQDGTCACLRDTSFSTRRKDEQGRVLCPFYKSVSDAAGNPALRCSRYKCTFQVVKGICSKKEMFEDCPWFRRPSRLT